ncbi:MAG: energy-coupling factor transporter transmembrane protein EcfT [Thermoplasmata archaeon]|uniref:Energy-coupling factor transporter transmembrane protein EcfT n=1 Tax=Candidatus Sysuiplasma superficiale TaxID=2823368 RepID=A0A8J7YPP4_9ARCH|nr:energy-coupling factor transporter transmembrane protein EcfT [Candidatus Sysuiplasma superficiale]MBX8644615.1 energy-coupling factor transporter transmembrane protein EcfT [Candidatus Sysuiplasma superficiale]
MGLAEIIFVNVISWLLISFGVGLPLFFILKAIGLSGFKEVTRFEKHDSFYYRLNPVTKIAMSVIVMIVSAAAIWWVGAIITVAIALSYLTLRDGKRKLLLAVYLTVTTVVGVAWGYAPFTPPVVLAIALHTHRFTTLWTWPSYFSYMGYVPDLTLQSIIYGLQISMRFTAISLASLLLVMTSTPSEILRSLNRLGIPVAFTFSIVVAMKTIPRIFEAIDAAIKIQFMRGLGSRSFKAFRPIYYLVAAIASIVPVLVFILRGARDTAISADTRAFRAYDRMTYMKPVSFGRADYYAFAVMLLIVVTAGIAIASGFGRALPYLS